MIKNICDLVCSAIAKSGAKYDVMSYDDSYDIFFNDYVGEDFINFHFEIVGDPKIVVLTSKLPFGCKKIDMSMATSVINDYLINGSFDFDIKEGSITYRITTCWVEEMKDSTPFEYLISKAKEDIKVYGGYLKDIQEDKIDFNTLHERIFKK